MRHRQLSKCILLVALLVSAWGQMLAATSCSHMQRDHACCHAQQSAHGRASHEMASEMQMTPAVEGDQVAAAFNAAGVFEACEHCAGRSSPPLIVALREAERMKRGLELTVPVAASTLYGLEPSQAPPVPSKGHSPPGASTARHVLVSVFRI